MPRDAYIPKDDPERDKLKQAIDTLIQNYGVSAPSFEQDLVAQMIETSLKLLKDKHDSGQLKLISRALKEMRYAYRVFNQFKGTNGPKCVSIFGSARTPEDHPDYLAAKVFGEEMAKQGWMCITGGANGIMKAGLEGAEKKSSFGLSIRLPFEVTANELIEGDPKLITFRYFFTRKLMFVSHSDALAAFPGGFGTLDELFEVLTLIQTGKANIMPVVLIEGKEGIYWQYWKEYIEQHLLSNRWISSADLNLFYIAASPQDAVEHITHFYRNYHSSRYVKDLLVIRHQHLISDEQLEELNQKFAILLQKGRIERVAPFDEESDHRDLPRIAFHHTRRNYGLVRQLIDHLNELI